MKKQEFSDRIYSFWSLRKSIGWIGIGLPFVLMIGSLIALAVFYKRFDDETSHFVFWIETVALIAFGISWLVKGEALFADVKK